MGRKEVPNSQRIRIQLLHEWYEPPLIRKKDIHPKQVYVEECSSERQQDGEARNQLDYEVSNLLTAGGGFGVFHLSVGSLLRQKLCSAPEQYGNLR
jgi:hypothetical protein